MPGTVDLLFCAYLLWGLFKGRRRGVGEELQSLINSGLWVAFLMGVGLFTWLRGVLSGMAHAVPILSGFSGAVLVLVAAFWLLRLVRGRLARFVEQRMGAAAARSAGGWLGLVRTGLIGAAVVLLLSAVPLDFVRRPVAEGSFAGRAVQRAAQAVRVYAREPDGAPPEMPGAGG